MLRIYGPLLGGHELRRSLGYATYNAFWRSRQLGELGVPVFALPKRKGVFALTAEVARWIEEQSKLRSTTAHHIHKEEEA
jgi:hypothetical protein